MATIKQIVGTRSTLTITGLSSLASATYLASSAYLVNTNQPLDVVVEVDVCTTNTASGNKQVVVFVQESLDGTNYRTGPTSGTTTTDEPNLRLLGTVPVASSITEVGTFSITQALGYCPYSFKIVVKNDTGVALTAGTAFTSEISSTVA